MMKKTNEVSCLVGVSRRTLQYYDDEGLLETKRSSDNHRLYDKSTLERIWEILVYKEMDFELKEIKKILVSSDEGKRLYLQEKLDRIGGRITDLNMQIKLIRLVIQEGIPSVPDVDNGKTYVECIEELREHLNMENEANQEYSFHSIKG